MGLVPTQRVGSSWSRDWTCIPCIGRWILNHWTTREAREPNLDGSARPCSPGLPVCTIVLNPQRWPFTIQPHNWRRDNPHTGMRSLGEWGSPTSLVEWVPQSWSIPFWNLAPAVVLAIKDHLGSVTILLKHWLCKLKKGIPLSDFWGGTKHSKYPCTNHISKWEVKTRLPQETSG